MLRSGLAPVAAVIAVAVTGCGGGNEQRETLKDYVQRANRTQAQFEPAFTQAQRAIRAFAAGRATPLTAQRLREASSTIRASRGSLGLIHPPPAAEALHADLLRLLDLQVQLVLEVGLAADYTRAVGPVVRPAETAAATLGRRLRAAETGDEQAQALTRYGEALQESLEQFDALAPPPFLVPWHDDQRSRLARSRRDALALAAAIRNRDTQAVERALEAFTSRKPDDAVRRAQTAAVKTFNRRLGEQERLVSGIAREQAALAAG